MHGFDSCWNNIGVDWPTWRTEKVQLMWEPDPIKESLGLDLGHETWTIPTWAMIPLDALGVCADERPQKNMDFMI